MKARCARCGKEEDIGLLDSKPEGPSWKRLLSTHGQLIALERAMDMGLNFTRLECAECYGPGYIEGAPTE